MLNLVVLWGDVVSRGVDYVCTHGDLGETMGNLGKTKGEFWTGKFEVANAMGVSGPTPLRGSLPRLLRGARGAPAGPGPARTQSYQGVQAIAQLSPLQVRWT